MKLSEVIKAIEDGSKSEYTNRQYKIFKRFDIRELYVKTNILISEIGKLPLDGWEEVKPPRQWSEKELMLFKLFPFANWIVKTKHNEIILSENGLKKIGGNFVIGQKEKYIAVSCDTLLFCNLESESPIYIGDLKGE